MNEWTIYTLADPRDGEIRYVGYTGRPVKIRYAAHLNVTWRTRTHVGFWIRSLIDTGLKPVLGIVETGINEGWKEAEQKWIEALSKCYNLCNHTRGGEGSALLEGLAGEVVRGKRRESMRARWEAMPEWRERQSSITRERMKDPAMRKASSDRMKSVRNRILEDPDKVAKALDKIRDPERRRRHSEFMKARWADPSYRESQVAKMNQPASRSSISEKAKLRLSDPDRRAAMSAIAKKRMADPNIRENLRRKAKLQMSDPANREKSRQGALAQAEKKRASS